MSSRQNNGSKAAVSESPKQTKLALAVYAAGSIATGVVNLIWHRFEPAHEPIQALGDHIPGGDVLACIAAMCLVAGGVAILNLTTARMGAVALACIYLIFGMFWLPRFYTAPRALGFHVPLLVSLIVGVAQQLILVAAAVITFALREVNDRNWNSRALVIVRWIFGLCSIDFGLAHLTGFHEVAAMVPRWMPLSGNFWAILTGLAFVAAGIAILSEILDVLATRLLALMLFIFSALVLVPGAVAYPPNHVRWGSNAYNLTAVGAAWMLAESLIVFRRDRRSKAQFEMDAA